MTAKDTINKLSDTYIATSNFQKKYNPLGSNLYICISKKGRNIIKSFVVRVDINKKRKEQKLGEFPAMRINEALRISKARIEWWRFEAEHTAPKTFLFSDLFEKMISEKKNEGLKSSTIKSYNVRFGSNKFNNIRNKDIKDIEIADIWDVLDKYASFESKKKVRTILNGVFEIAKKRGLILNNIVPPLSQISGKRSNYHSYIDPISDDCLIAYLKFIDKIQLPHIKLALALNLIISLRRENLLALDPKRRLKIVDNIPVLQYAAEEIKGGQIGDRPINYPIPAELAPYFQSIHSAVFPRSGSSNTRLGGENLNRHIRKFAHTGIVGIKPYLTLHSSRSTFASYAMKHQNNTVGIDNLLSHNEVKNMAQSSKHYIHSDLFIHGHEVANWWYGYLKNLCVENEIKLFDIFEVVDNEND